MYLARAKREAVCNINSLLSYKIKKIVQCYRNSKTTRSVKNNNKNGVICKKKIARAAHIFLRYYDVKLPSYTFHFVPVPLFFTAAHFHLGGRWHFSFSHRRYKIFMFFFQQIKRKIENWFPCLFFFSLSRFSTFMWKS